MPASSKNAGASAAKPTVVFSEVKTLELDGKTFGVFRAGERVYTGRVNPENGRAFAAAIPAAIAKRLGIKVGTYKGQGVGSYKGWTFSGPVSGNTGRVYPGTIDEKVAHRFGLL
ncbi:MAG: hypothetical protein KGJ23_08135 [Euryarchaeota archaeon]|nr:hypothetical protein [Euryarchaeota archaeon]MDE1836570.1 hypothetical protein [Euryarchaeota archaeon]MDE1879235.1 hypothetical protein [Euryarchaeota archaeon]MDE2044540.1 hypothetical protein [Thermoplasmata archaeon]